MYGAEYNILNCDFQYFDYFIKQKLYSKFYLEIYNVIDLPDQWIFTDASWH